jgi:signal transduction histidine kinase
MNPDRSRTISDQLSRVDLRIEPKKYCHDVLGVICRNLGFHFGSLLLVDKNKRGDGNIFSAYNLPPSYPQQVKILNKPILSSPSGDAIREGKTIVVNDIESDPRLEPWRELLAKFNIKTVIWVPLFEGGKAFGTMILYHNDKRNLTEDEFNLLTQMAALFSLAIISNDYIVEIHEKSEKLEAEIAERKKIEEELIKEKERAEAASRAKTEFLSNMSHEIRTPMNAILGFSNILLEEETDPSRKEALEMVHGAGESLLSIINDILDLSKIEAGRLKPENFKFSLPKLIVELERIFRPQATEKNLQFDFVLDPEVPKTLLGDRYKFNKIIGSILRNAFKFTRRGHVSVQFSYTVAEQNIVTIVSDSGIGIPQEKQELIFEAFKQADGSSTRQFGGTGLGLTIAGKLAALLGGSICLDSEEGAGTTFYIQIPMPPGT